jgi:hypothetical protein
LGEDRQGRRVEENDLTFLSFLPFIREIKEGKMTELYNKKIY